MNQKSTLLVRYGEIGLKGGNRPAFERALCHNLVSALGPLPGLVASRRRGRILLEADVDLTASMHHVAQVFGVTSFSPVENLYLDPDAIITRAAEVLADALKTDFAGREQVLFRISVNRGNKSFPLSSLQFTRQIAENVMPAFPQLKVDLKHAELNLEVDIREEEALVFARRIQGPGGLPSGTMGRGLTLLSGGIDSPVAAWMCMKRGMRMEFVSFYSFPHVGPQSREKIIRIAEKLAEWQPRTVLHMVPFTPYQEAIRDHCPPRYRTVLYRRAMQRIASLIAARRRCRALITGESLGQVSTLPAPDCCTVFQPQSPVIFGRLAEALEAEKALDLGALTFQAVKGAEKIELPEEA
jgi:tRNA uracil 4-sulfurtransferase